MVGYQSHALIERRLFFGGNIKTQRIETSAWTYLAMHIIRYQRCISFFLLSRNYGGISWSYETNDICTALGNG